MEYIFYNDFESPIGNIKIAITPKGVHYVEIVDMSNANFESKFRRRTGVTPVKDNTACEEAKESFRKYFDGQLQVFDLALDLAIGTVFQKKVWNVLQTIPFGSVRTYRWVAEQIGSPQAVRAVGNANGRNPIPIIIPCHRIVCTGGKLGGFSSGIKIKKQLLAHEKVEGYC